MALWIDRDWVGLAELTAIDSEVPSIAEAESIDVEGDGSVCREAFAECSNWLTTSFPSLSGSNGAAAFTGVPVFNAFRLEQVVMTEQYGQRRTPLMDWLIWSTLAAFYRAAVRRALNDRYERKLELAEREVARRLATVRRAGVPIVANPLPCPGAVHAPWAGSTPGIASTVFSSGVGAATTVYYAATFVSWCVESAASAVGSVDLGANESFSLSVPSPSFAASGLKDAYGWRVYLGSSPRVLKRSAAAPMAMGAALADGRAEWSAGSVPLASNGQLADSIIPYRDLILRG